MTLTEFALVTGMRSKPDKELYKMQSDAQRLRKLKRISLEAFATVVGAVSLVMLERIDAKVDEETGWH
jgi:hypothetical protein